MLQRSRLTFSLLNTYPNPFKGRMTVRYAVPYVGVGSVVLTLVDGQGRQVWHKTVDWLRAGANEAVWDGRSMSRKAVSSGAYFLRLSALDEAGNPVKALEQKIVYLP
jgi:hypothetical protein